MIDIQKIKKLIKLVETSSISRLEITEGKKTIRITRAISKKSLNSDLIPTQQDQQNSFEISSKQPKNNNLQSVDEHIIRSPMVGIFYRSNSPNDKPFVTMGQFVKEGDTLCIIEAMKIMNQIQSDKSGYIKDILIDDGKPVEFGEPLLVIK